MSLLEQVAAGSFVQAADQKIVDGQWVDSAVAKGQDLIANNVQDEAIAAGLKAALNALGTPEAKQTLVGAAQHEFTVFTARIGMGARGAAREAFIRTQASFAERHRLLQADTDAAIQATTSHTAFVDGLEKLAVDILSKGGAALIPFLFALL